MAEIDIFISYKREERDLASSVSRALQQAGYSVVTDLNIQKAADFGEAIDQMISASKLVIVLWTSAASTSEWVRKEATEAERQKKYFGVLVEPVNPANLPFAVRTSHLLDISGEQIDSGMKKIAGEIATIIGPATSGAKEAESRSATRNGDLEFYQVVDTVGAVPGYEEYLRVYPHGIYATESRSKIQALSHWSRPLRRWLPSIAALTLAVTIVGVVITYLSTRPQIEQVDQLEARIVKLEPFEAEANLLRPRAQAADVLRSDLETSIVERDSALKSLASARNEIDRQVKISELTAERDSALKRTLTREAAINRLKRELELLTGGRANQGDAANVAMSAEILNCSDETEPLIPTLSEIPITNLCVIAGDLRGIRVGSACYPKDSTEFWGVGLDDDAFLPIKYLTNLHTVDLSHSSITDLTPLDALPHLRRLEISGDAGNIDFSQLAEFGDLEILELRQSSISDLCQSKASQT